MSQVYVSITGLVLTSPLHWVRFAPHAGAHLRAMQVFTKIGHGKTYGFEADTRPGRKDVPRL